MLQSFLILQIAGFVFVSVTGSLLHFVFHLSGKNRLVGVFSPVNESTWEHLKMLFFPVLLYSCFEYLSFGRYSGNFIPAASVGILIGLLSIVAIFYTYTGIVGRNFLAADILTFILGVAADFAFVWRAVLYQTPLPGLAVVAIPVLAACFVVFTFYPPRIGLFHDPASKRYGISQ